MNRMGGRLVARVIHLEHRNPRAIVNGGELKQPFLGARDPLEEFHVHLQPVTWLRLLTPLPSLLVRLVLLIGRQPAHPVSAENAMHR